MPEDDAVTPPAENSSDSPTTSSEDRGRNGIFASFSRGRTKSAGEPVATEASAGAESSASEARTRKRRTPLWLETVVLLVVALGMAVLIKTFLVQAFYIPSASMEPGLVENDRILVEKASYWFGGEPQRGDVIVFADPGNWLTGPEPGPSTLLAKGLAKVGLYPTGGHLVKRVIGTPGDTVTCCDADGQLEINGVAIDEDDFIRPQHTCDGPMPNACQYDWTVTVPDDRLFVMGDNRAESADSSDRLCGPPRKKKVCDKALVPMDAVVGKVFALVWPAGHAHFITRPDVFDSVPDAP